MESARSFRIVPGAASFGFVAPMISRTFFIASFPSKTIGTIGPAHMNVVRLSKNGLALWTAIKKVRDIMGATNPKDAAPGTIRKDLADSIESNIVHGSDAPETAVFEIGYFFNATEILK